ncbi:MAG TPA: amino acid adenylation domain-containing protein [Jatrophihabitans sp.]|nr:amino acid adenylation domain-containing protein [Jatrophihabitans sp.]
MTSTYQLTACQRDVWVANSLFPELPQFNVFIYDRIVGSSSDAELQACLSRAAERNDVLRMRIDERNGVPYQWLADTPPAVELIDLSGAADPRRASEEWLREAFDTPFEPLRSQLVQLAVIRESPQVAYVYVRSLHILNDAWSLNLIMAQFRQDLSALRETGKLPDRAAPSYLAAIELDREFRASPGHSAAREYFHTELAGLEPALYQRREPAGGRRSARHHFTVERELIERMRSRGHSVFAFMTGVLCLYLSRVHRTDDVCVGVPLLNRPGATEQQLVGHFANTLPLRLTIGAEQTFTELVTAVRAGTRGLKAQERLAIGDLLAALPNGGHGPKRLFDVTIAYLQWPTPPAIPGLHYDTVVQARAHDDDALGIVINELDDTSDVHVDLDYGCDVFDDDYQIQDFVRHLETLLRSALDEPDRPAHQLPMLAPDEVAAVSRACNQTRVPFDEQTTVPAQFRAQAARTPDAIAVLDDHSGRQFTYRELDAESDALAAVLHADGVRADEPVAILVERSPAMIIAVLAVLKAGGAYLPIDSGYPAERIEFILRDSGARIVLHDDRIDQELDWGEATRHDLSRKLPDCPRPSEPATVAGHDLAYIIYTSGSTGRPKGALIEHRSVMNRLRWMDRRYPLSPDDVLIQKTPISFDVSVWELFWWMLSGARVVLLAPGHEKDPRHLARAVAEYGVTVAHFVPSMLDPFLDLVEEEQREADHPNDPLGSLQRVFCSGEALLPQQARRFAALASDSAELARPASDSAEPARLVNLYGPTEATVDVSYYDCPAEPARELGRVPIGRPIDNLELLVMDRHGLVQPVGLAGELYIAGVGVARGYLNRPELTAAKFVANPAIGTLSDYPTWYRTGDLVTRDADGELHFLGRIDGQVKVRGNRVELGEVEVALTEIEGVRAAVAVGQPGPTGSLLLVAYYVGDPSLSPAVLRRELQRRLPDYLVPSIFQPIDAIPLNSNGKADRSALALLPVGQPAGIDPPRTELEAAIAEVWQSVLKVDAIGVHDNYFTVGGDSITMLQIRAAAERRGVYFELADLIRRPTIAGLAESASSSRPAQADEPLAPCELLRPADSALLARPGPVADAVDGYPATDLQLALLYHSAEHEHSAVYHDVFRYSLRIRRDEQRLVEHFTWAFELLQQRHPVLRSWFDLGNFSEPVQLVAAKLDGGVEFRDLRSTAPDDAEAAIRHHVADRRFHHYDLAGAPLYLFRVHLLPDTVELVFSFHHAILDGWSVATLVGELLQDYLHLAGAPIAPVGQAARPSPGHYVRAVRQAEADPEARRYWQRILDGVEPIQLTGARPHVRPGGGELIALRVELPTGLEARARTLAREHRLPLKSILFAAHVGLLRLLSGADDITTGLVTGGRPERHDTERVTGLFLGTLPVRVRSLDTSWLAVAEALYAAERDNHEHRRYPLSAIQRDLGGRPPFDTAFNFVHLRVLNELLQHDEVDLVDFQTWEETNFGLLLNAVLDPADDRLWLRFDLDGRTFDRSQAEQLADSYLRILDHLVEHPGEAVGLEFLPTTLPEPGMHPRPHTLLDRLDRHARHQPSAVAIAHHDIRWTYERLWQASETIARRLIALGARPGQHIGLAMRRSPETIAAIIGVAKAGCACVPLDVTYPPDRIARMVERSRPIAVVTSQAGDQPGVDPALVVPIQQLLTEPAGEDDASAGLPRLDPDSVAYVLFTSGSTGVPKGVEIPHRVLANYAAWQEQAASGRAARVTLQFAPLSFDVAFQEIVSTLYAGGQLQLIDETHRHDMPELLRLLESSGVERVFLPYVALQQLAEASVTLGLRPPRLATIISSGEQLRVTEHIRQFCAALPGTVLENQYGPTETHLLTSFPMTGDPQLFPELPPIGRPITGVELLLLDDRLRQVPDGGRGELYARGLCLADGYLGQPELTAERFSYRDGVRIYRTGDLATRLPGGELVWLGRADSQVKVRGFRVELAEVELAIRAGSRKNPALADVAVIARSRATGADAFLVAYLIGDPAQLDIEELRGYLHGALPGYMVPSYFEWVPAFPRTASGKRDDAALAELPLAAGPNTPTRPARDSWEAGVLELVRRVLESEQVGVEDNFFEVGGTSLSAMRLTVLIEKHFGVPLPVSDLIASPSVAALAARLRSAPGRETFDPVVPIRPTGSRRPLFLVHPLGGNVLCYRGLAERLGADQPVYALQAPGSVEGSEPLASVPDLAARYVAAIRRIQPTGPYNLGGWSFGGFIAFEMARQISAVEPAGVAQLVLIDPIAIEHGQRPDVADRSLLEWFFWEMLWAEHGGLTEVEAVPADLDADQAFDFVAARAAEAGVLADTGSAEQVRRLFSMFKAHWRALLTYEPEPVAQDLVLLRATAELPPVLQPMHGAARSLHADTTNGWSAMTTGHIDVVDVDGDHLVLMDEPYVAGIADTIDRIVRSDTLGTATDRKRA